MNNPSPLVPQGSLLEQKSRKRSRVRTAIFCVLALHVIPITVALLMQGCRRNEPTTTVASFDTNAVPQVPDFVEPTPAPVEPSNPPVVEPSTNPSDYYPPTHTEPIPPTLDTQAPMAPTSSVTTANSIQPMVAPESPSGSQEYTIVRGDTFSSIASRHGVSIKAMLEANPNANPRRLQIGQKIQIPAPAPAASSAAPSAMPQNNAVGQKVYKVVSGDTLTKIAGQFHTTVKALRAENNLITDRIKVGQKLKIPQSAPTPQPIGSGM